MDQELPLSKERTARKVNLLNCKMSLLQSKGRGGGCWKSQQCQV